MRYMNRVTTLISGGRRRALVAVLYHGEAEWAGKAMLTQKPARRLCEAQIGFDCIPTDVFAEPEHYKTGIGSTLRVNTQEYKALVIPYAEYVTEALALSVAELKKQGCPKLNLNQKIHTCVPCTIRENAGCIILSMKRRRLTGEG